MIIRMWVALSWLMAICPLSIRAQTGEMGYFEGIVHYKIQFKGESEDAAFIRANNPNDALTMMVGEGNYIVKLSGGKYEKTFIFIADSNYEYSVDLEGQRAFRRSAYTDLNQQKKGEEPVAEPTGRTREVGEYTCQEYRMKTKDATFFYYVNERFRIDLSAFPDTPRSKAMFLAKGLDGMLPLRTVKRTQTLAVETTMETITRQEFTKENFTIPEGFIVKGRDYRF